MSGALVPLLLLSVRACRPPSLKRAVQVPVWEYAHVSTWSGLVALLSRHGCSIATSAATPTEQADGAPTAPPELPPAEGSTQVALDLRSPFQMPLAPPHRQPWTVAELAAALADPREVLLSGATGFLGAHLLHQLLGGTRARVHCLVRCDSAEGGALRLQEARATCGLDTDDGGAAFRSAVAGGRVISVPADLAAEQLGMGEATWQHLVDTVDCVVHCGAVVNWMQTCAPRARPRPSPALARTPLTCLVKPWTSGRTKAGCLIASSSQPLPPALSPASRITERAEVIRPLPSHRRAGARD